MLSDDSRTFVGSLRSDVAVCVRSPCDEPHRARLNPGNGFPKKLIKPGGIGPKPPTRTGCGMAAFITHPSVRIKGTEHNYNPVLCQDDQCAASSKGSHMHCPFCSVTEAYQDPVILRAHYRVKHVDKGLDFAGLKVLRCCNHCEIVGTIKGEKKFKGAHWHCYRCRNGFNRRDEAVKHYKTHFRNPHTTFQIQITQEVNNRQYYEQSAEAHLKAYGGLHVTAGANIDVTSIGSILAQTVITTGASTFTEEKNAVNLISHATKDSSVSNGITVAAEETVGSSSSAHQTLVLMDSDGESGNIVYEDTANIVTEQSSEVLEQNLLLEKQLIELHQQNQQLQIEKAEMEKKLKAEIQQLKDHIVSVVQANVRMAEELRRYRSSEDIEKRISKMVEQMEWQHRELLQTQLAALRKEMCRKENKVFKRESCLSQDSAAKSSELAITTSTHTLVATTTLSSEDGTVQLTLPRDIMTSQHSIMASAQDMMTSSQMDIGTSEVISFIEPSGTSPSETTGLATLEYVEVHLESEQSNIEPSSSPEHVQLYPIAEVNEHGELMGGKRPAEDEPEGENKQKVQKND
ncbi:uncharacterized protein ZGC:193801 isoform X2 [Latimeria chalumnae]|uniref:uncharacterized protein ZGC:193801 isoform X2 n=1 Tax=Latimeria chalumnae TaxID=7897 RepID=UPI00313D0188